MNNEAKQNAIIEKMVAIIAESEELNARDEKLGEEHSALMIEEARLTNEGKILYVELMLEELEYAHVQFSPLDCFIAQASLDLLKKQIDYHTRIADYNQRKSLYLFRKAAWLAELSKFSASVAEHKAKIAKLVNDPEVREVVLAEIASGL